jgi:hypothetical protein
VVYPIFEKRDGVHEEDFEQSSFDNNESFRDPNTLILQDYFESSVQQEEVETP